MSFTLDGIEIATQPVSMVRLACDSAEIMSGHSVGEGDYVHCTECTRAAFGNGFETALTCMVTDVLRTEMVPTVHVN